MLSNISIRDSSYDKNLPIILHNEIYNLNTISGKKLLDINLGRFSRILKNLILD